MSPHQAKALMLLSSILTEEFHSKAIIMYLPIYVVLFLLKQLLQALLLINTMLASSKTIAGQET